MKKLCRYSIIDNNKPKEKKRTDFASFGQIFHDNIGGFGRGSSPIIKRIVNGGFGTDDESKKAKTELDKVKKEFEGHFFKFKVLFIKSIGMKIYQKFF